MSFTYNKATFETKVNAYPNKPLGLHSTGFIFRSDSNSEDMPGFAGAGLFDSYPMNDTTQFRIEYYKEKMIVDEKFKHNFMENVGKIGVLIEDIYNES